MDTGRLALRFGTAQVEGRRMARNRKRISQQDEAFDQLEDALTLDTDELLDAELEDDVSSSIEDLEAQISLAAEELARESREASDDPSDMQGPKAAGGERTADEDFAMVFESDMAQAKQVDAETLTPGPVKEPVAERKAAAATPSPTPLLAPANDDQQRTDRGRSAGEVRAPRTIYWATTALSTIWVGGTL